LYFGDKYPDFMMRDENLSYESRSILGKLYREVKEKASKYIPED
jgi:hypothetical protein